MICMRQDFYVACKESCVIDFLPLAVYGTDPVRTIGEIVSVSLWERRARPVSTLFSRSPMVIHRPSGIIYSELR